MLIYYGSLEYNKNCYVWDTDDFLLEVISVNDIVNACRCGIELIQARDVVYTGVFLYKGLIFRYIGIDAISIITKNNKEYILECEIEENSKGGYSLGFGGYTMTDIQSTDAYYLCFDYVGVYIMVDTGIKVNACVIPYNKVFQLEGRDCLYSKALKELVI